jgi:hypothetical protein
VSAASIVQKAPASPLDAAAFVDVVEPPDPEAGAAVVDDGSVEGDSCGAIAVGETP